jgi:hypothetical protein
MGGMMDLRALESRLENWARAQRSSGIAPGDAKDAHLVNEAWKRLMPFDKDILRMHYIWRAPQGLICRRLKLKQGRGNEHVFESALRHAHGAIHARLENSPKLADTIRFTYNATRLPISVD